MTEDLLREISAKLSQIIGLLALSGISDDTERAARLNALGLDHKTVAALTGLTANAVALRLSRSRRMKR